MASPTVRNGTTNPSQPFPPKRLSFYRLPLGLRRCGAWVIEVSLVAASALVPLQLGLYVKSQDMGELVPLNSVLSTTEAAIARTLAIPVGDENQAVPPLTNLLWTVALVAPLVLVGSQLYLLGKTGKTTPKRWLGIQVAALTGAPPGVGRVVLREGVGRWGLPLGTAYLIWLYTGAFPALNILAALGGLMLAAEGLTPLFNRQRRAFHDRLAGTIALDTATWQSSYADADAGVEPLHTVYSMPSQGYDWVDEDGAIAAIVLSPERSWQRGGLWQWMRQHPGITLLTFAVTTLMLILGTFVGTQIYIQAQTNQREAQQQQDQMYLALVNKLSTAANASEKRAAVLALATIDDPRATPLLTDLLAQETDPKLVDAIEQALVSLGAETLPYLQKLNQALRSELASLAQTNQQQRAIATLRQRATQRAIAKILTIYSGQMPPHDLSRVDLSQVTASAAPFTLVLDQIDVSGIKLRGATLTGASLRGSRWYGAGQDDRLGTYDDWIADLSGAELKTANLTGALLSHVSLRRANLTAAILNKANLTAANLIEANLSSASLIEANLQQTVLEHASLTGANLGNADLSQANLHSALLGQVNAVGAHLQSANLSQSDWRGADLSRADLSRANLREADLSFTQLHNASLRDAQLQNANLRDTDLSSADFRGANLNGADFAGAFFVAPTPATADQFIQVDPSYEPVDGLRGVDFSEVRNLNREQIDFICFQGGLHPTCPEETR
jgi:uncharacterized protein YjbI with pentapeptide repeats/uncharacterized RDD family membrane protein YckC